MNQCLQLILAAGWEVLAQGQSWRCLLCCHHWRLGWDPSPCGHGEGRTPSSVTPAPPNTVPWAALRAEHPPTHLTEVPAQPESPCVLPQSLRGGFWGKPSCVGLTPAACYALCAPGLAQRGGDVSWYVAIWPWPECHRETPRILVWHNAGGWQCHQHLGCQPGEQVLCFVLP